MAANIFARIDFFGNSFDVPTFEKQLGISFKYKTVKGSLASRGRFKGHSYPYGSLSIVASDIDDIEDNDINALDTILDFYLLNKDLIHQNTDIEQKTIEIVVECSSQCNWHFSSQQIKKLADSGMDVNMSHIER